MTSISRQQVGDPPSGFDGGTAAAAILIKSSVPERGLRCPGALWLPPVPLFIVSREDKQGRNWA